MVNLDIGDGPAVDYRADATSLPFSDGEFDVVVSQECLEHVADANAAVREMFRVLRPGGTLFLQLPWVIGWHDAPHDYWRFSRSGMRFLCESAGFGIEEIGITIGPATAFRFIAVEFIGTLAASVSRKLYKPAKGAAAVALYPLGWLDPLMSRSSEADRIARGYYVIGRKPGV
jgi:SAM-dependent methyltransferase